MRSEKDQMTVGKEKSVVEIQFRDIPREQENAPGNLKQKEEKKEVFTKVGRRALATRRIVYAVWKTDMEALISAPRTATVASRQLYFQILFHVQINLAFQCLHLQVGVGHYERV